MLRIRFSSSSSTILSYSDHIFSWSQCYIGHTKHGIKTIGKKQGEQCELSVNLEASFTICLKKSTFLVQNRLVHKVFFALTILIFPYVFLNFSRIYNFYFLISFSAIFSFFFGQRGSAPQPEAATSTRRPKTATSRRCGTCSVSIRRACTNKTSMARGLEKLLFFCDSGGVEGGFGANSFNSLKFGAERNEFVGFLLHLSCILGLELPDSYY